MHLVIQTRRWRQVGLSSLLCLAVHGFAIAQTPTAPASPAPASPAQAHHTSTSTRKKSTRSKKTSKKRGQQAIDSERAREIQTALIREHYMQGEPTGKWDAATQAAMQRYQADQGWQSKQIPDSRALIKLGLGPSQDHLLNPESAMTTTMPAPAAAGDPKAAAKPAPPQDNLPKQ
jgi:peptidoglycan hydrolase-like protein with peptidoglycan-binding domain